MLLTLFQQNWTIALSSQSTTASGARAAPVVHGNLQVFSSAVTRVFGRATFEYPLNLTLQARDTIQLKMIPSLKSLAGISARLQIFVAAKSTLSPFARIRSLSTTITGAKILLSKNLYLSMKGAVRVFPRANIQPIFKATASVRENVFARLAMTPKFFAKASAFSITVTKTAQKYRALFGGRLFAQTRTLSGAVYKYRANSYARTNTFAKVKIYPYTGILGKTFVTARLRGVLNRSANLRARTMEALYSYNHPIFSAKLLNKLRTNTYAKSTLSGAAFIRATISAQVAAWGVLKSLRSLYSRTRVVSFTKTANPTSASTSYLSAIGTILLRVQTATFAKFGLSGKIKIQSGDKVKKPTRARPPTPIFGDKD